MNLYKYGIEEEQSDIRAHVSLPGRRVTVYRTADMVSLIASNTYRQKTATQPGVECPTALGWLIPLDDIQPQYVLKSESFPWNKWDHRTMDCGQKGDMAVVCVRAAILANKFPLWVCGYVNGDKELDIQGTDIIVSARRRIQVKYDAPAYPKQEGGTGNLYIQTHECNPLRIHGELSRLPANPGKPSPLKDGENGMAAQCPVTR